MHQETCDLITSARNQIIDIMPQILHFLAGCAPTHSGLLIVNSPHTTAGIMINEKTDPHVREDILNHMERLVPRDSGFKHLEGNSDAHIKTMLTGVSVQLPVIAGKPLLGTWQTVYFCDYDGPRKRELVLTFLHK
jgi:secondary thiamine-phosphate synthase enzyme